jgi:probable phosphoglycerate mutase
MTTFLLIRHAAHELVEHTLAGRMPGVHLSAEGQRQARRLARRLACLPVAAVYSSPIERALQTAEPLAARLQLAVQHCDGFAEIDFGEWSGKPFDELASDLRWQHWNRFRSGAPLPGGGLMVEVQARAVVAMDDLRRRHPDQLIVVVSHGDVIKAVIAHYLGMSLELLQRMAVSPASVSVVAVDPWGAQVIRLNATAGQPAYA